MILGNYLYDKIEENAYLNELYENILYNYSLSLFGFNHATPKKVVVEDALRFADILSKSTHPKDADKHKILAQEIVAILDYLYPNHATVTHYLGSVLSSNGNYRGMEIKAKDFQSSSLLDRFYTEFSKELLRIPADSDSHFFRSQWQVYEQFCEPYFSFSGPTSMGKSFIMRMFIKEQVMTDVSANFAIIVPTKALINEVSSNIINDLKELLSVKNYRVVTSAGSLALEQNHNFIFVLTPERLLYLLIRHNNVDLNYLFVDEAHKISAKDSRSAFYYKVVDMLIQRKKKPHIIFASPNIPNPEVYLGLIPYANKADYNYSSTYSPVSQTKFLLDFVDRNISLYNEHSQQLTPIASNAEFGTFDETLKHFFNNDTSSIIYINSKERAMQSAKDFAAGLPVVNDKELDAVAKEIRSLIHKEYFLADIIAKGVAFHVGYLPSAIRMEIERLFREKKIRAMFCTSTLVEGVNLPADNLFITTYRKGRGTTKLSSVDFRNLVGRVGRIEYNLYGNVFLTRIEPNIEMAQFIDLLKTPVHEQKLSLVSGLTPKYKTLIVNCLSDGNIEIPKDGIYENTYALIRKFAIILLRDIMNGRNSAVKDAFAPILTPEIEIKIKAAFDNGTNKPDDDINASVDQINLLAIAISQGLCYPEIDSEGKADHAKVLSFLQQLYRVFKWGKYENDLGLGDNRGLSWYATLLCQWVSGSGLSSIMYSAVNHAQSRMYSQNPKRVSFHGQYVPFDNTPMHRNLVIAETLQAIENVVLFSFSNYFLKFSECYKRMKHIDGVLPNDWYEYVEYGTTNALSIMLQRNGFSREASLYIKDNQATYVVNVNGVIQLKLSLANCPKEVIRKEIADLIYNTPELFLN